MKAKLFGAAISVALLFLTIAPAMAVSQPGEGDLKAACDTAFNSQDWVGVEVECKLEGQAHFADAEADSGELRNLDLLMTGSCLSQIAFAQKHLHEDYSSASNLAREAYDVVLGASSDARVLGMARSGIQLLEQLDRL